MADATSVPRALLLDSLVQLLHAWSWLATRIAVLLAPRKRAAAHVPSRGKQPPPPQRLGLVLAEPNPCSISLQHTCNFITW
jgi:hypothetical protein